MVGRIALLIAYGPEARAFLQSGLAARLAEEWEVAVVTPEPASAAFDELPYTLLRMPVGVEGAAMARVRAWGRGSRRRAPALRRLALRAERAAGRLWGGGLWSGFLKDHAIGAVVAASATGSRTLPALQAAANRGLPTAVLLSSWRDLCGRGEPPTPLTALGVVTRDDLARLDPPRSRGAHVAVCGSLHDAAVRHAPAMSRADFCGRLSLDPDRPIVLYATAANDGEEAGRVTWLAERLQGMEGRPQLLIRSNPMDVSDGGYAAIAAREGVALLEPRWEWAREREWNCPLPADLPWWRGALEHAALAVTLPSTVALDLAAWGKPTLNVAWGRGAALWAGESYAAVRSVEGVVAASDPEEAVARIGGLLQAPPKLVAPERDPLEAALRLLRRAFQVGDRHAEPGHGMSSPYNSTSQDAVGQKAATP